MCWYSADHAASILEAESGQRLTIRKVHGGNWAVRESDLQKDRPTPVCLIDNTKVLFRFSELPQSRPEPDMEGVFRMLKGPKRDVVRYADGREIAFDSLPEKLVFDVLMVPGKEELSEPLNPDREPVEVPETRSRLESFLARVF
jgi:hypothetical protein